MKNKRIPWARVAAEFIAILAGVTLAFLADDWREFRWERVDERLALQELLADLEADSLRLSAQLQSHRQVDAAVLWALGHIEHELPPDTVLSRLRPLFYYTSYVPVSPAYRGLRDSGKLPIIRNATLRREVVEYYEVTQPNMKSFFDRYLVGYDKFKETTAPYIRLIPDSGAVTFRGSFRSEMVRPWREMREDHDFLYRTENLGGIVSTFALRIEPALTRNSEIRRHIREVLE